MSRSLITQVDFMCKNAVELAHSCRKIGLRSFNEKMIVIGHETVGMDNPPIAIYNT